MKIIENYTIYELDEIIIILLDENNWELYNLWTWWDNYYDTWWDNYFDTCTE